MKKQLLLVVAAVSMAVNCVQATTLSLGSQSFKDNSEMALYVIKNFKNATAFSGKRSNLPHKLQKEVAREVKKFARDVKNANRQIKKLDRTISRFITRGRTSHVAKFEAKKARIAAKKTIDAHAIISKSLAVIASSAADALALAQGGQASDNDINTKLHGNTSGVIAEAIKDMVVAQEKAALAA